MYCPQFFMISFAFAWQHDNCINVSGLNIEELNVLFFDVIQLSPPKWNYNIEERGQKAKFYYTVNFLPTVYLQLVECILCRLRLKIWQWIQYPNKDSVLQLISVFSHAEPLIHNLSAQMLILNFDDNRVPHHKLSYSNASIIIFTGTEHHSRSFRLRDGILLTQYIIKWPSYENILVLHLIHVPHYQDKSSSVQLSRGYGI